MEALSLRRDFALRLSITYAISLALALLVSLFMGFEIMGLEHGPLEDGQEVVLLMAAAVFFFAAKQADDATEVTHVGTGLLCVIFFLRELELDVTGPVTAYLESHAFRWHEGIALAVILIPYLLFRRRFIRDQWNYVRSGACWPFLVVAAWLLIGDTFDKVVHNHLGSFLEEWAELNGYLTLLLVAYAFTKKKTNLK